MNRERLAWIVSIVLLALLAFQLPGTLAQRDDDYDWVRSLVEIHRQIVNNYVEPVDDNVLKEKAIEGMVGALDKFSDYIPPESQVQFDMTLDASFKGVGVQIEKQDNKVVVITPIQDSPADKAGILAEDVITMVDGVSIGGMEIDDVMKTMRGPNGTRVKLTIDRNGKTLQFSLIRQDVQQPTVLGFNRRPDQSWNYWVNDKPKIAYIRITQFDSRTFEELQPILAGGNGNPGLLNQGMQGLIVDLRFNPGGLLDQAVSVVNLFVKQGVIVTTKWRNRPEEVHRATGDGTLSYFPLVVLVNDESASAAEIVSGSLKDNGRAMIVGQRTFGKGSVQDVIDLGDNDGQLKLTEAYYYLPSGRLVHRKPDSKDWGVEPQVNVTVTEDQEDAIYSLLEDRNSIRGPATMPSTEPSDPQFAAGLKSMIDLIVVDGGKLPTTFPSTQPTTQPTPQ